MEEKKNVFTKEIVRKVAKDLKISLALASKALGVEMKEEIQALVEAEKARKIAKAIKEKANLGERIKDISKIESMRRLQSEYNLGAIMLSKREKKAYLKRWGELSAEQIAEAQTEEEAKEAYYNTPPDGSEEKRAAIQKLASFHIKKS